MIGYIYKFGEVLRTIKRDTARDCYYDTLRAMREIAKNKYLTVTLHIPDLSLHGIAFGDYDKVIWNLDKWEA